MCRPSVCLWPLIAAGTLLACTTVSTATPLQVLRNGGFEEDELTYRAEPASSCGGEQNDRPNPCRQRQQKGSG